MTLVGMFFTIDRGERYLTGQVVKQVSEGLYLVRTDNMGATGVTFPMEMADVDEMLAMSDGIKAWSFFETREELNAWIGWLDSASPPQVISLVKK